MPGFDGTGPMGWGSMTGGGRGFCKPGRAGYGPYAVPDYFPGYATGFRPGGGFRRGRGIRRGPGLPIGRGLGRFGFFPFGAGWYGPGTEYGNDYDTPSWDEITGLKGQADALKSRLDSINRRIQELEGRGAET